MTEQDKYQETSTLTLRKFTRAEHKRITEGAIRITPQHAEIAFIHLAGQPNPNMVLEEEKASGDWAVIEEAVKFRRSSDGTRMQTQDNESFVFNVGSYKLGMIIAHRALRIDLEEQKKQFPLVTQSSRKKLAQNIHKPDNRFENSSIDDIFVLQQFSFRREILKNISGLSRDDIESFIKGAADYNFMLQESIATAKNSQNK